MMKRFKFLGALFIGLIGLVSFGYCGSVIFEGDYSTDSLSAGSTMVSFSLGHYNINESYIINCSFPSHNGSSIRMDWSVVSPGNNSQGFVKFWNSISKSLSSTSNFTFTITNNTAINSSYGFHYYCVVSSNAIGNEGGSSSCDPQYTSEECQQEYSLMPINSCNSEYCGLNGLCPEYTGSTMSELYINGINHLGAPIINISIPLEQAWDYEYTGDVMNINLSGENNVDYEYIDNIIKTQRSTPDDEDLNNIVSGLIPLFVPGLVLIVFIIFIFRFIKKIF